MAIQEGQRQAGRGPRWTSIENLVDKELTSIKGHPFHPYFESEVGVDPNIICPQTVGAKFQVSSESPIQAQCVAVAVNFEGQQIRCGYTESVGPQAPAQVAVA